MTALFVGSNCTDFTMIADEMPKGNQKVYCSDYHVGIGGNAAVASFTSAKFGVQTDFITAMADDPLSQMIRERAEEVNMRLLPIKISRSSATVIMPNKGNRPLLSYRNTDLLSDCPEVDLSKYSAVHYDGYFKDIPVNIAKKAFDLGILTSLDGGHVRDNTEEILPFTRVAAVSEDFAANIGKTPGETLQYLAKRGVQLPAITLAECGMLFLENGIEKKVEAFHVPLEKTLDTTGAGDIFHGSYVASYVKDPSKNWEEHFTLAAAAAALSIQIVGTECSIPALEDVHNLIATRSQKLAKEA